MSRAAAVLEAATPSPLIVAYRKVGPKRTPEFTMPYRARVNRHIERARRAATRADQRRGPQMTASRA